MRIDHQQTIILMIIGQTLKLLNMNFIKVMMIRKTRFLVVQYIMTNQWETRMKKVRQRHQKERILVINQLHQKDTGKPLKNPRSLKVI